MNKILEALSATKAVLEALTRGVAAPTQTDLKYVHKLASEALALDIWKEST